MYHFYYFDYCLESFLDELPCSRFTDSLFEISEKSEEQPICVAFLEKVDTSKLEKAYQAWLASPRPCVCSPAEPADLSDTYMKYVGSSETLDNVYLCLSSGSREFEPEFIDVIPDIEHTNCWIGNFEDALPKKDGYSYEIFKYHSDDDLCEICVVVKDKLTRNQCFRIFREIYQIKPLVYPVDFL